MTEDELDLWAWQLTWLINKLQRCTCGTDTTWHSTVCPYRVWKTQASFDIQEEALKRPIGLQ